MAQLLFTSSEIKCTNCRKKVVHVAEAHPFEQAPAQCLGCGRLGFVKDGVFIVDDGN